MPASRTKLLLVIGIFLLASLACNTWNYWFDYARYESDKYDIHGDVPGLYSQYFTPTPRPTRTKGSASAEQIVIEATTEIKPGTCAWRISPESDAYPLGQQGDNFYYGGLDNGYGMETLLIHSNPRQDFTTWHVFEVDQVYYPEETVRLSATFRWENKGDSANAALVKAGGVSMLTVGDVKLTARNDDINVRTQPEGSLSDSADWIVPEGAVGDRLTLTQHISTGSYGVNIRWHYDYACN